MGKAKKFVGPSKRMAEALENEGLRVDWPETIEGKEDLAIEATFYTGMDWEKCVTIDLRNEGKLKTKNDVDRAIANQLDVEYACFSVDDEMALHMQGTEAERRARGVPEAARLLEDMQEQEKCLKRFSDVADAVANGREIPHEYDEARDGEDIHLTPEMAKGIRDYLKMAYPMMNNLAKCDLCNYINTLNSKLGSEEVFNG